VHEAKCLGFSVITTSPSGEPAEDDGRVEVKVGEARFAVPFKPAMFTGIGERPYASSRRLRCQQDLVAYEVRPSLVILALSRSGRPGLDVVSFALVDLAKHETVQVIDGTWEIASGRTATSFRFVTRDAPDGFDIRLVRETLPDDDSPTGAIEDWLRVQVKKGRLTTAWLRP
jgi:hypothetical protein